MNKRHHIIPYVSLRRKVIKKQRFTTQQDGQDLCRIRGHHFFIGDALSIRGNLSDLARTNKVISWLRLSGVIHQSLLVYEIVQNQTLRYLLESKQEGKYKDYDNCPDPINREVLSNSFTDTLQTCFL